MFNNIYYNTMIRAADKIIIIIKKSYQQLIFD